MNGSSDHWKFYTASELLEADFGPYPGIENRKIGDRWGNWILRENLTLQYKFGTQDEYEIDLERITTSDEALDWIANLVERGLSSVDLGDFVRALNDCIPLREKLLYPKKPGDYRIANECTWFDNKDGDDGKRQSEE